MELQVASIIREAEGVLGVTLINPDGSATPHWEPGAHIDFVLPNGRCAQYSLCGPLTAPHWRIAVLLQKDGRGTSRDIHESLRVGDVVGTSAPRNNFALLPAREYLFIAGGIGITPFLSMIEAADRAGLPWRMVYGGRDGASMAFTEKLRAHGSRVVILPQDRFGLIPVTDLAESLVGGCRVYCCGPEPLLVAVQTALAARGLPEAHVERFQAAPVPSGMAANRPFIVHLARSGRSIEVGAYQTIVEALNAHGIAISTSCGEGVCGTCETRVLAGEVDHRDVLLTDSERARNDTILACVSRAKGDSLKLDL